MFKARFLEPLRFSTGQEYLPVFLVWRGRGYMDTSLHPKVKVDSAGFLWRDADFCSVGFYRRFSWLDDSALFNCVDLFIYWQTEM